MPAPRSHRNLLPSTNAALEALEAATGQPVTLVEDPELSVAATMRRARASEATHILRRRGGSGSGSGSDPEADYLITFQCRMALRDVAAEEVVGRRQAFADLPPEHRREADTCLTRALALGPPPDLAERLRQTHSRLARQVLRANADGQPRMDVVTYCASALQTYASLTPAAQKQLLMEVATAGQKGLKINDPDARLQLRHLPNHKPVTALQAACLLFVGVQLLLPGQESGFDFQREFEIARGLVEIGTG
jgi:hypothetical protein